jgi:CubicO group peptidase (beta-lactamase class C family)
MAPTLRRRTVLTAALLTPLVAACGRAAAQAPPTSDPWAQFDEYLRGLADAGQFSGAVLVTADGKPLLQTAYGAADRATGEPITADTLFCVGSMGKMFTAVAVAQLVERGSLAFTDTVGQHLPGFPPEIADAVTLHQLLTHTSGMGDIFGDEPVTEQNQTVAALLDRIRSQPLQFTPGSSSAYSNAGFVTAGAIVEQVAGRPYADYVREHVFGPAGMPNTAVRSYRPAEVAGMAHPHALVGPDGRPLDDGPGRAAPPPGAQLRDIGDQVQSGSPAGGAISTVADMTAFARALTAHRLVGVELTDTLITAKDLPPQVAATPPPGATAGPHPRPRTGDKPPGYGYGFGVQQHNGVRIVGHNGGTPGYEANLDIYPDTGRTAVVLVNQDRVLPPVVERSQDLLTT